MDILWALDHLKPFDCFCFASIITGVCLAIAWVRMGRGR